MRISTQQIYTQGIESFQHQQAKLSKLQEQISTGVRLTKPSDDPSASTRVLELEQSLSLINQYQSNISSAENRLELEEGTLSGLDNLVVRVRELAIQANNASLDDVALRAIGIQIDERMNELMSLANSRDNNGEYLFAGFQNRTEPFTETQTGSLQHVVFNGDQGQRLMQISETRQVAVDDSGKSLFLELASDTALNDAPSLANTGISTIAPARVFDASVYAPGTYEIRFTAPGIYDVFDVGAAANIVTGATYTDGDNIDFQGIRTSITGVPATGDVFTVSQGQFKDVFEMINGLSETLKSPDTNGLRAANIAGFLDDIDVFHNRILDIRTSVGGRLNTMDSQLDSNISRILSIQETLSSLRDTDLAEAISQLSLEQTTLEAAQAVFTRMTRSTLFDLL
jgi:flagellar hook-associated protein 3 FlgL